MQKKQKKHVYSHITVVECQQVQGYSCCRDRLYNNYEHGHPQDFFPGVGNLAV